MVVVLGVDPGTHVCGWGVVSRRDGRLRAEGFGVVKAPSKAPVERRLAVVAAGLKQVVARYRPAEAAIEEVFYGRDVRAAVRIGEGRGAALVVLADAGIPVRGYANNVVKRAVTGAGRAGKERVQSMVKAVLGLRALSGPLDASDALALAICHWHQRSPAMGIAAGPAPSHVAGSPPGTYSPRIVAAIAAAKAAEAARRRAAAAGAR